jgi:DNA-binding NarL/FixJ family response regulator
MSERLTHILLIDDDPIFRLGLRTALEGFPDVQVIAEVDTGTEALFILGEREDAVDLVVLELAIAPSNTNGLSGLALCQQLKTDYPNLPVLLLTAESEPRLLMAAKASGVEGYCAKGCTSAALVQAIRQLMSGQPDWQISEQLPAPISSVRPPSWHHRMRSYGLQQIENTLAKVTQELQNPNLSNLDWVFWSGRRRELLAARWVVNQLLPTDVIVVERQRGGVGEEDAGNSAANLSASVGTVVRTRGRRDVANSVANLSTSPRLSISASSSYSPIDATLAKLQSSLSNFTGVVLEIDILQAEKRQDLLYIVLQKFAEILEELRFSQITLEQLPQKRSLILRDLWQVSITDFFGKYYTLPVGNDEFEVVNVLLSDAGVVQDAILNKIPLVVELLGQQLFESPLVIDNVLYSASTPEATARAEFLLQNLIIQVANAVIQPLLNEFADVETIKQSFYNRSLISSREIARFRNNLSWRYRLSKLILEPQAIFESRYNLFVITDTGIKQTSIYAPRRQELEQLRGIPLVVTLAYETRDAIAPRLRATIGWVGRGVVYILTQVVGRSIGLVVRGVIQGVGSTLQDTRFGKNSDRGK